jgi:nucleoid DNA-binding protein
MSNMTKADLVRELAEKADLTQSQVEKLFDTLEVITKRELKKGNEISPLPGLVKLKKRRKAATASRAGRNPRTGDAITISAKPAHDVVGSTLLKRLKDMVL